MNIDNFNLPSPELYSDNHEHFLKYYNIDINLLNEGDKELLLKYREFGAVATIMDRILKLQRLQNPEIEEETEEIKKVDEEA